MGGITGGEREFLRLYSTEKVALKARAWSGGVMEKNMDHGLWTVD